MLTIEGIPVEVRRKRIKHLHLYVKPPDGHVLVTAPLTMSDAMIERFVRTKTDWLKTRVARFSGRPQPAPMEYVSGETVMVWGEPVTLLLRHGGRNGVRLDGDTLVLTARETATPAQREKILREWYRAQLTAEITRRLPRWEAATGLSPASWQTKAMHTRWGTCNVKTRKLWFAVQLASKPPACLDYIILHELLHLLERKHNARFYGLLDQYMQGWRERKAKLR